MNTAVSQKHLAEATVAKVRRRLQQKAGENGIRGLSRALNVTDDDGHITVAKDPFAAALEAYGIVLSPEELKALWFCYDRDNTGALVATEFITALRGGLAPARRALVQRVFGLFAKNADGSVAVDDLRARFDPSQHPSVLRGQSSAEAVHEQFLTSFDESTNPDGLITRQEFEQYYAGVSASIDDDGYFAALMRGCWQIPATNPEATFAMALDAEGGEVSRESRCPARGPASSLRNFTTTQPIAAKEQIAGRIAQKAQFEALIAKHRAAMLAHKMGFRAVGRLLRQRDADGIQYLTREDFLRCLWQNRLYVEDESLLSFLDTNADGSVDYGLYMALIMGELPPARQLLLERFWRSLPADAQGRTDLSTVHRAFRAPDGVALNTFLDAWDARLVPSGKVAFVELLEWMLPISVKMASDAAFEKLVKEQWRAP